MSLLNPLAFKVLQRINTQANRKRPSGKPKALNINELSEDWTNKQVKDLEFAMLLLGESNVKDIQKFLQQRTAIQTKSICKQPKLQRVRSLKSIQ